MALMNGVTQWKFQRLANLMFIIAAGVLVCALCPEKVSSVADLKNILGETWFKLFFGVVLVFACLNSILAGWQIAGDYAEKVKVPSQIITVVAAVISVVFLVMGLCVLF